MITKEIVFFRPDGDHRQDHEVKREIYENEIKDKYDIFFAIDDRQSIVDMRKDLGVFVLDVRQTKKIY